MVFACYTIAMKTVSDIIDKLGGNAAVARVLNVGASTTGEMRRRSFIHIKYWSRLKNAAGNKANAVAENRSVFELTDTMLVDAHTVYKTDG